MSVGIVVTTTGSSSVVVVVVASPSETLRVPRRGIVAEGDHESRHDQHERERRGRDDLHASSLVGIDRPTVASAAMARGVTDVLGKVRELCLDLPEVNERLSHGAPTFFIRDKKTFVTFHTDHHGDGRVGIWAAAPPGAQEALIASNPKRYYRPAYVGHRGWIGMRLEGKVDWDEAEGIIEDAYRTVAPKKLVEALDRLVVGKE